MNIEDIKTSDGVWTPMPRIWVQDNVDTTESSDNGQYAMAWTKCTQDEHNGIFEALAMAFGIAIFITNLVVVAAIKRGGRKLHKATFYCICNLAVADMLTGMLLLWVFGLQRVVLPFRTAQSELVQKSVWTLTVWSSLMSQVVIAIDRYSHVTRGSNGDASFPRGCDRWGNKARKRMVIAGISLTWLIPTVTYVIPVMTTWNCASNCSCYIKNNNTEVIYMTCLPLNECSQVNPPFTKSNMLFLSSILLLMPLVPIILYSKIFFFVRNSSKNLSSSGSRNGSHAVVSDGWHTKRGTEDSHGNYSKDDSSVSKSEPFINHEDDQVFQQNPVKSIVIDGNLKKPWRLTRSNKPRKNMYEPAIPNGNAIKQQTEIRHSSTNHALRKRSQRRDMRLLRTLVIILALFVVSTVPLGILFVVSYTETDKRYVKSAKYLLTLSLLNSLVNPWVYFWRFREMREAIRRLFCSPCSDNHKHVKAKNRRDDKTGVCCHIPSHRKMSVFSSHSTRKQTSSSSSSAF